MRLIHYLNESNITYSKILTNKEVLKDKKLTEKLRKLDHKILQGGFGAVLNYPDENPSTMVIAYDKKEPIGWISLTNGYQNIFVNPEYRSKNKPNDIIASTLKDKIYKRK